MALSQFKSAALRKNRVCHQWKNKKKFRAEKARKALMTLRLTQCHQNWLTMMAGSANFEDIAKKPVWVNLTKKSCSSGRLELKY